MSRRNDLVALVGSRICHDLISPMGAIGNGVELLEMSQASEGPELSLISESVAAAQARIRFFRIAYGNATEGAAIGRAEVAATLAAAARGGRLSYFWEVEGPQPRGEVKAVFLMLQCFETAMPHGGDITVRRDGETWEMAAESPRLKLDEGLWAGLTSPRLRPEVGPAQVQFALLPEVLDRLGRPLAIKTGPDRILARF